VADFYRRHPGAARHIRAVAFGNIPFRPMPTPLVPRTSLP
jgi:hypothetical protein